MKLTLLILFLDRSSFCFFYSHFTLLYIKSSFIHTLIFFNKISLSWTLNFLLSRCYDSCYWFSDKRWYRAYFRLNWTTLCSLIDLFFMAIYYYCLSSLFLRKGKIDVFFCLAYVLSSSLISYFFLELLRSKKWCFLNDLH